MTIPLFPLGTVLLPGALLPLHIFEPRYRQLVVELVTGAIPDKQFGVVAVREGWTADDAGMAGLHHVGCTAELVEVERLPDGRFEIVTRGQRRFRLLGLDDTSKPYLVGEIEYLPDEPAADPDEIEMLVAAARAAHRRYCATAWRTGNWTEPSPDATPETLPHVLAADCVLSISDRQQLLEQTSPTARLRMIRTFLARETALLTHLRAVPAPISAFAVSHSVN